jgi:hypothetical protein
MSMHLPNVPTMRGLCAGAALAALAGCASGTPPNTELGRAELAVQQAVSAQAGKYAPADLSAAQTDLADARQAVIDGNFADARRKAELAESEARLAQARTGAAQAREASQQMSTTVNALGKEATTPAAPVGATPAPQP